MDKLLSIGLTLLIVLLFHVGEVHSNGLVHRPIAPRDAACGDTGSSCGGNIPFPVKCWGSLKETLTCCAKGTHCCGVGKEGCCSNDKYCCTPPGFEIAQFCCTEDEFCCTASGCVACDD